MYVKPTQKAEGNIFDISEDALEMLLYPANDEVPCPWDADIYVESGIVHIHGHLGPNGPRGCMCECTCPVDKFTTYYKLEVPEHMEGFNDLVALLEESGWIEA